MARPKVFIIILNWNSYRDTIECLKSLQKINYPNYKIMLVDNGSTDGSSAILKKEFPTFRLIQTGENLGYAGGNNVGIRYALKEGANFILLLNPDTLVTADFLSLLVTGLDKSEEIGMVCPKGYYLKAGKKTNIIWGMGGDIVWWLGETPMLGLGEQDQGQFARPRFFDRLAGACLLIRREVFEKVGFFDERYFLYFEETDLCVRSARCGYKFLYVPSSIIYHEESASVGKDSSLRVYYFVRNRLFFMRKNCPRRIYWFTFIPFFSLKSLKKGFGYLYRGEFIKIRAMVQGLFDFFRGRLGRGPLWLVGIVREAEK